MPEGRMERTVGGSDVTELLTDVHRERHGGARDLHDVTVLLVEDDHGDRRLFSRQLDSGGLRPAVVTVGTLAEAVSALRGPEDVDVVLLDLGLPDSTGLSTLDGIAATGTAVPVVILTGHGDDPELAVAALRRGAHDYLVKGQTGASELARAIRYAIERHQMQRRASGQLLHQAALHQLEMAGSATADLQGFAQAAVSALQVGLDAPQVTVRLEGASLPMVVAATAVGDGAAPAGPDATTATFDLEGPAGHVGRIEVVTSPEPGLTADQRRFLATAASSVTARVERLVAGRELSARTRQLDTVQRVAESLQHQHDLDAAVDRVSALLVEGLRDDDGLGVTVEVEGHVATAGPPQGPGGIVVSAPVTVRGERLGSISLHGHAEHAPGPEERTVLQGVAAQLGTWWALARADREHRRAVDRITQLMQTAPVGLALVDVDGLVRFANAAALELVGAGDVADFPWRFDGQAQDRLDPALAAIARVRATGTPVRGVRVAVTRPDGTEHIVAVNASPLAPGPAGRRGMAVSLTDVTAERRSTVLLESALDREQRATEELRRVGELKDGFLRALSHELRTPLASIIGFIETLQDHGADLDPDQITMMLGRMESNAQRLGLLLEDLLDVGRLTAGVRSAPTRSDEDLADVVRAIVGLLPWDDHHRQLALDPAPTHVDRTKIERVVHNLISNGIRHTPPGTTIRVTTRREGDAAVLVVDDDGPGIPDRDGEDVFEPFVQGDHAATSANPGTGVGLSLVRQLVELHGGTVALDVGPLGGARFTVALPDPA